MLKTVWVFAALFTAQIFVSSQSASASDVVLTIDGKIAGQASVDLTMTDIMAYGRQTVMTRTPWHDTVTTFEGVPIADLIDRLGATGETLSVMALNNYYSEIPVADLRKYGVILAYKQDGAYMPVSDKGPLFVVYPFDAHAELHDEVFFARSAWQVRSITVE